MRLECSLPDVNLLAGTLKMHSVRNETATDMLVRSQASMFVRSYEFPDSGTMTGSSMMSYEKQTCK